MPVCFFNSLPNGEYSNHLIVAEFSNSPFSVKHLQLLKTHIYKIFPDDKTDPLAFCLSKSY